MSISETDKALLLASASSVSSHLDLKGGAKLLRATACYLPVSSGGDIVAGKLSPGVYVATGHSCWGILNGPATGEGMAQMILGLDGGMAATLLVPFAP